MIPFFRHMASRLRGVFSIHTEVEEDAGSKGAVDGLLGQSLLLLKLLSGGRGRCCESLVSSAMYRIILIHSPPNILIFEVVVLTVNEVVDEGDNCWRCAGDARN